MALSIKNLTKKRSPRGNFEEIKDKILGKNYELSLVFCGDALSKKLNRVYRGKDKATNVLSFTVEKNSGEIFINLNKTEEFSPLHLFIHGCLHLNGMEHGRKMDQQEKKFLNGASNRTRHRHRHLPN